MRKTGIPLQAEQALGRLVLLDGLRGLAAIGVLAYHLGNVFGFHGPFARSYLFVDFFFLLSGFVLTLAAEARMNGGWGTAGFMRARIKRLWPMIAVGAMLGAVATTIVAGFDGVLFQLALALLLIPILSGSGPLFPLNGPQWSLLFEIIANLFHGVVLRKVNDSMVLALAAISGLLLAWVTLGSGSNTTGPFAFNWWYGLPRVAFAYTLGVWFGRKWMKGSRGPLISWTSAFCLPAVVMIMLPGLPLSRGAGDTLMVLLVMPALFWFAATSKVPAQAHAWLEKLGALSFPLYAVHLPILELCRSFGKGWPMAVAAAIASLLAAHVLATAMERTGKRSRQRQARVLARPVEPERQVT